MLEQHFYEDDRLNWGYVYTNLSKDIIQIVQDDMEYMSNIHAVRRENLCNVVLRSEYCERPAIVRNRLGPDFKKVLAKVFEDILLVKNRQLSFFILMTWRATSRRMKMQQAMPMEAMVVQRKASMPRTVRLWKTRLLSRCEASVSNSWRI